MLVGRSNLTRFLLIVYCMFFQAVVLGMYMRYFLFELSRVIDSVNDFAVEASCSCSIPVRHAKQAPFSIDVTCSNKIARYNFETKISRFNAMKIEVTWETAELKTLIEKM